VAEAAAPADLPKGRHVGLVGLGQMGRGIAANLDRAGLLAAVHDADPRTLETVALSGEVRRCPPGRFPDVGIVLFAVPGSKEIEAVLAGPDGLLATAQDGQIIVDLTTSDPVATGRLAEIAGQAGRHYVDAGMSGGAMGAEDGRLTLMVGGDSETVARCGPVFDAIAERVIHVGGVTAGHTMKLVHNMVCHTIFLATSEGCRTAEKAGISLDKAVEVLNAGNARSFVSEVRFPRHILSGRYDGRSRVSNLAKDLAMAAGLASTLEQPAPYAELTAALLARALEDGLAEEDFTRLHDAYDGLAAGKDTS
jgi:3-hydroxyisobutyrate dehydrogenase